MNFGEVDLAEADGALLAHSIPLAGGVLKKGTVLGAAQLAQLQAAGIGRIVVARFTADDVVEDCAAARIAVAVAGDGVRIANAFTGRVNVFAVEAGIATIERAVIERLNAIDEGLTIATLAPFARVAAGQMVATVKIIPFALPEAVVAAGERTAAASVKPVGVAPFQPFRAALVLSNLAGTKPSVLAKRARMMAERVVSLGGVMAGEATVAHDTAAVAAAIRQSLERGCDVVLVFGASAIVDRGDVVPAGLISAGGEVIHLGMPVDPGNLLMLGHVDGATVIGVPSCASSPKLNGFDWVLERVAARLAIGRDEIVAMAVGGLLMEIASRPQPRQG